MSRASGSPESVRCGYSRSSRRRTIWRPAHAGPRAYLALGLLLLILPGCEGRAAAQPPSARPAVHYDVWPVTEDAQPHILVQMELQLPGGHQACDLQMPNWSPGDYRVQHHGMYVRRLRAFTASGAPLTVTHPDAATWRIANPPAGRLTVTYWVPNTPPGLFSQNVQVESAQVFVNGPAAFLYCAGDKEAPDLLTVHVPVGWSAVDPLPKAAAQAGATGGAETQFYEERLYASGYDELVDSPLLLAPTQDIVVRNFFADGVQHRMVFFDHPNALTDLDAFVPVINQVVQAELDIMRGPPYASYTFFFDVGGPGGGLEHRNSARLSLYPGVTPAQFAPFAAHEFFHLWNVKRIRPAALGPFDYIHPPAVKTLWFVEGFTEYYARIAVRRAGLVTPEGFEAHWTRLIDAYLRNPEEQKISADESSLRVWEANNSSGFGISYYDRGELIALCLDLAIRHATAGLRSLNDVMRMLLARYAPPHAGYHQSDLLQAINKVAGTDLSALFNSLTQTAGPLPLAQCLGYAGLDRVGERLSGATPEEMAIRRQWEELDPKAMGVVAPQ